MLFRVVKVRRAMLRETREGAKPNGLMAAVLAIRAMEGGCRDGGREWMWL